VSSKDGKCPRCGHENVSRALFCFRCGRDLNAAQTVDGVPGTGKLVSDALRFIKERGYPLESGMIARLEEGKMKMPPENISGESLTCLHCGTLNRPEAAHCIQCQSALIVPDDDFNLILRPSARTNIGQVRHNNEDNVHLWAIDGVLLALVADGMGGAAAGEVASGLAVEAVQADFLGKARDSDRLQMMSERDLNERLKMAIYDANMAVIKRTQNEPPLKGMGTTSTLLMVRANRALIAHVGDSRAYYVDGSLRQISQMTNDHSFVQALVTSGHITADQAESHPMRNVLYRALGQSADMEVDLYSHYLRAEDRIIMCSDGLTRHLEPTDILKITLEESNPHAASQRMIELANQRGGEDNVSVIVIKIAEATSDETIPNYPPV